MNVFLLILFNSLIVRIWASSDEKVKDLHLSEECKNDILRLCEHVKHGSNLEILLCLQRSEKVIESITKPCQHSLWQFKKLYLNIDYFNSISNNNCLTDFNRFGDCTVGNKDEKVICFLKHKNEVVDKLCQMYLDEASSVVFSDIFLVHKFLNHCDQDVENLKCGRLQVTMPFASVNQLNISSQASTINCLVLNLDKVHSKCRKEILRLGELQSDDFHYDPALFYACREDREILCGNIESGKSQVYRCLEKNKYNNKMSAACVIELNKRQKLEGFDYKIRKYFTEKCSKDIINHKCVTSVNNKNAVALSTIILCLLQADNDESTKTHLDPHCRSELLVAREQFAKHPEMSVDMQSNCAAEIKAYCSAINTKTDDIMHCLMRNSMPALENHFSANCTMAMKRFFKTVDPTEDIAQLDPIISQACSHELRTKCYDQTMKEPDNRYECLLRQIDSETGNDQISSDCKTNLLSLAYFVERDYSLNHKLHKNCHSDATKLCKLVANKEHEAQSLVPHAILHCLVQHWNSPRKTTRLSYKCDLEIKTIMKIEASNVKLNFFVYTACFSDVMNLCKNNKYKMDCLQMKYHDLQSPCKTSISEFLSLDKEEYSLKKLIARSCGSMVRTFCRSETNLKDTNYMNCLIHFKFHQNMDKNCRIAIEHYQIISIDNLKINHKFARFCSYEIKTFCGTLLSNSHNSLDKKLPDTESDEDSSVTQRPVSKSDIISCLSKTLTMELLKNKNPFTSQCYEQFTFEFLQQSASVNLDPEMHKKCEIDINNHCAKTDPDQVLSCLQAYQDTLSDQCVSLLIGRQQLSALDPRFDGGIQRYCRAMIDTYCSKEPNHRIFRCLHINMRRVGFDKECKLKVINRLRRRLVEVKLNPELIDNCRYEMEKYCNASDLNGHISEIHHNHKLDIVNCLRSHFVEHRKFLRANCRQLVFEIVMDANADYRLDPNLYTNCNNDVKRYCSEDVIKNDVDTEGQVQDCLKKNYMDRKIPGGLCAKEISRLLREGRADVHVDVQLYNACRDEISRICYTERLGAGQKLSCLLWALDNKNTVAFISTGCKEVLFERKEMWELASKMEAPDNVQQVLGLIAESRAKYYIMSVFCLLFLGILLTGIICGRISKRVHVIKKRR